MISHLEDNGIEPTEQKVVKTAEDIDINELTENKPKPLGLHDVKPDFINEFKSIEHQEVTNDNQKNAVEVKLTATVYQEQLIEHHDIKPSKENELKYLEHCNSNTTGNLEVENVAYPKIKPNGKRAEQQEVEITEEKIKNKS